MRIRWRGVARVAAIVVVGLIALRIVPSLLRAPEPPPLGRDVGLPKASVPVPVVRDKPPKRHRGALADAPAATAKIGTRTRRHRHHKRSTSPPKPAPEQVESAPPPAPEYVPPPLPEPVPTPLPEPPPEPRSVPGDGSQEFAPH